MCFFLMKIFKCNGYMRKLFYDFSESEVRVYELLATLRRRDGIYLYYMY